MEELYNKGWGLSNSLHFPPHYLPLLVVPWPGTGSILFRFLSNPIFHSLNTLLSIFFVIFELVLVRQAK